MVALMAPAGSLARAQAFQNEATVAAGPNVTIDAVSSRHTISPYIYGTNYDQNQIPDMNPSIIRWGGDGTSQYNWQTGSTNAGSDWYFINGNQNNVTNPPDFDTFLATNQNAGIKTIGTIPINGWVAKDGGACAFSVKKYGAQQAVDPYTSDCGNGIMPDGKTPITPSKTNDPADADVSEPASFMQDWVTYVVSTYGATANGGVAIWELDNEPVWWSGVHQNIHPLDTAQGAESVSSARPRHPRTQFDSVLSLTSVSSIGTGGSPQCVSDPGLPGLTLYTNGAISSAGGIVNAVWNVAYSGAGPASSTVTYDLRFNGTSGQFITWGVEVGPEGGTFKPVAGGGFAIGISGASEFSITVGVSPINPGAYTVQLFANSTSPFNVTVPESGIPGSNRPHESNSQWHTGAGVGSHAGHRLGGRFSVSRQAPQEEVTAIRIAERPRSSDCQTAI
jgi:hypothetical protein